MSSLLLLQPGHFFHHSVMMSRTFEKTAAIIMRPKSGFRTNLWRDAAPGLVVRGHHGDISAGI